METTNTIQTNKPKNIFRRIWDWFMGLGSGHRRSRSTVDPLPAKEEIPEPIKQLHDNIDKETLHHSKSLLLPEVEQDFSLSVKFMIDAGFGDGVTGVKKINDNDIKVIARSRALRLFKLAKAVLGGLFIKAQTEEEAKRQLSERSKEEDVQQHHELNALQYYRNQHARSFSIWWGAICIIVGFLLFAADIPLSRKLFEDGFNLRRWESWALAGGISLCTIFIKIYFDNYIGLKFGNEIMVSTRFDKMFKRLAEDKNLVEPLQYSDVNKKEQLKTKKWYKGILLLSVATLIVLGIFRVEVVKNLRVPYAISLLTFTFLSFIFPVISGICLSIGFTCLQNRRRYKEAIKKCTASEERYIQALKEYTSVQKEKGDIESEMAKWKQDDFAESYTQILLSYYNRGYAIGLVNPDAGTADKDLYSIAEKWRAKVFARKTNNHIIKISN